MLSPCGGHEASRTRSTFGRALAAVRPSLAAVPRPRTELEDQMKRTVEDGSKSGQTDHRWVSFPSELGLKISGPPISLGRPHRERSLVVAGAERQPVVFNYPISGFVGTRRETTRPPIPALVSPRSRAGARLSIRRTRYANQLRSPLRCSPGCWRSWASNPPSSPRRSSFHLR